MLTTGPKTKRVLREPAYRQDYSDATAKRWNRRELGYSKRKWEQKAGENLFPYSDYATAGWVVSGHVDEGAISVGVWADQNVPSLQLDETFVENGVQTWSGDGDFESVATFDVSSYSSIVVSLDIGFHRTSESIDMLAYIAISSISDYGAGKSVTINGDQRVYIPFTKAEMEATGSDLTSVKFLLSFSSTTASPVTFYWQNAQLEHDVLTPGYRIRTAGAAASYPVDFQMRGVGKIHSSEWELVQEPYEGIHVPREGQDQASFTIPPFYI
jgi:hypothetical protein